ncbi:MAG: ComF family protein [Marmoricola sp.]
MGAAADLLDAWADLVHGSACVGCGMPGRPWCRSCGVMLRRDAAAHRLDLDGLVGACAGDYEGWLRELILLHKEHSAWSLAAPLGVLLSGAVRLVAEPDCPVLLVPVPSGRLAVRRRGHDPTLRMTRAAAAVLRSQGIEARALPLLRLRLPVRDSVGLSAAQRRSNLIDAFALAPSARRTVPGPGGGASVVICDDVVTTGTTAHEAHAALALAGVRAAGVATVAAVGRPYSTSQVNPRSNSSAGLGGALTSCHGVRPGPWLRRVEGTVPDSASRCQSQAKRST